jgi:hypothetical protein
MDMTLESIKIHFGKDPIGNLEPGEEMSPWEYRPPKGIAAVGNVGTIRAANSKIELSGYRKASAGKSFLRSTILVVAVPLETFKVSIPYESVYRIRKKEGSFLGKYVQFDIHHDSNGTKMVESFTVFDVHDAEMLGKFLSEACINNLEMKGEKGKGIICDSHTSSGPVQVNEPIESKSDQAIDKTPPITQTVGAPLPDPLFLQRTCVKCGRAGFDYDSYFREYTCKNCGWQITKPVR